MHICIVCNEYPDSNHGGIGSFAKDLAEGLTSNGFDISIIGVYSKYVLDLDEPIIETINGVHIERYPFINKFKDKRLNYFYNRYFLKKKIKKLNKKHSIDVIEIAEHDGWMPFGSIKNIPMITRLHSSVTLHGKLLNKGYSKLTSIFEKWQLKKSDYIVSVSKFTAVETLNIFNLKKEYKVIYNSIKIPKEIKKENIDRNLILFTGSVVPRKGVTELIKAMPIVLERFPKITLKLAGKNLYQIDGKNYEEYLRNFVPSQFQNNIEFLGPLNREIELMPLIQKANFCVFPSHVEAFSLAPIEAMALGKAVVFTKYVSGPELIEDGVSGLLADTKNPDDIANKIIELLEDEELSKNIAYNGKIRVDEMFSYDRWINENIRFYKEVTNAK
ncbi:MAG: hypothetical protein CL623_11850 [Arcobacter sp.]|nr:hypothetical protein [Arcobacter sp.]|tara:strand:- start:10824 stop:11984 length:1161 start_codon:yes stop_codon:yes gene_type:complete